MSHKTMPHKSIKNPLGLNPLQLRTLTVLQACKEEYGLTLPDLEGGIILRLFPKPHGDHFHIGPFVIATRDASGLHNPSVLAALHRKGLIQNQSPEIRLTAKGLAYETGLREQILRPSNHRR